MDMTPITSTSIAAVGYDKDTRIMHVRFSSGGTYAYANFPEALHDQFVSAHSPGKFFHSAIKNKFNGTRIGGGK